METEGNGRTDVRTVMYDLQGNSNVARCEADKDGNEDADYADKAQEKDSPPSPEQYIVEKILGKRKILGKLQYKVKWEGYTSNDATWEPVENLKGAAESIAAFEEEYSLDRGNGQTRRTGSRSAKRKHSTGPHDHSICAENIQDCQAIFQDLAQIQITNHNMIVENARTIQSEAASSQGMIKEIAECVKVVDDKTKVISMQIQQLQESHLELQDRVAVMEQTIGNSTAAGAGAMSIVTTAAMAEDTDGSDRPTFEIKSSGRTICPRCGKDYSPKYILKHFAKKICIKDIKTELLKFITAGQANIRSLKTVM